MTSVRRPGFTIMEMAISLAILGIVFTALAVVLSRSMQGIWTGSGRDQAAERATQVIESIVRTIRQAQPSSTGGYPVINATNSSLTIYASTGTPSVIQQIRFFTQGTELRRGIIEPSGSPATYPAGSETVTVLLTGIQNGTQSLFEYFDEAYTGSQNPMNPIDLNQIRFVRVTILFDTDLAKPPGVTTIRSGAQLRNLKTNY